MLTTLFIAFALAALIAAAPHCVEHRTIDARRRERCPECGYNFRGLDEIGRCPECQYQYSLLPAYRRVLCLCPERARFIAFSLATAFAATWVSGGLITSAHGRAIAQKANLTFARGCDLAGADLPLFGGLVLGPAVMGLHFLLMLLLWKWPMRRIEACQRGALTASAIVTLFVCGSIFFDTRTLWGQSDFDRVSTLAVILIPIGAGLGWAADCWIRVRRTGWGVEA
ncbi:MAG: hypothetical protein JNK25_14490 [Phycisphaerae bacterium]|nr:hypothetical protein [Phycisphaerae bacterium]